MGRMAREVAEPKETARRGRGPGQLLLALRSNSPSRALRDSSVPPASQSKAGGTGAYCAPLWGGSHSPSYCNSKWVEAVWRDNAFTRAARPEGKGVDSQEGENRRCSPSCAPAARSGFVPAARRRRNPPARWERVLPLRLSRRIRTRTREIFASLRMTKRGGSPRLRERAPAAPRRCSPLQGPLRQRLTALPPPLKGEAGWVVQAALVITRTRGILRSTSFRSE